MIRALIIDDERLARQELRTILRPFEDIEIAAEAASADEALELIERENPDLLFLDIQMPGKNGFDLLSELEGNAPEVIFVTAYDAYAMEAFRVNALDYLMKPVEEGRLMEAMDKVRKRITQRREQQVENVPTGKLGISDQVFLKDGEKCWFVELERVRLFESEGNYIRVYFDDQRPLILKSLNALTERLSEKHFFRASRKHVINLRWIQKVEPWFNGGLLVVLRDGTKVEVSRRQSHRLRELMTL